MYRSDASGRVSVLPAAGTVPHVVRYSSLDDAFYVEWQDADGHRQLASVPRPVLAGDSSLLLARIRHCGCRVEAREEEAVAARLRDEAGVFTR